MIAPAVATAGALVAAAHASEGASPAPSEAVGHAGRAGHVGHGHRGRPGGRTLPSSEAGPGGPATHHVKTSQAAGGRPAHQPAKRPARPAKPHVAALRCTGTSGMLPQNYATIVAFLAAHGYSRMAAAGIAGNMYQESGGNPESTGTGGGGLIGFTPLPAAYVTGNPAADLQTQLRAVLAYNQQWATYLPALNAAATPTQAADVYMNDFERPGMPAAYNREAAANAVATACGF